MPSNEMIDCINKNVLQKSGTTHIREKKALRKRKRVFSLALVQKREELI